MATREGENASVFLTDEVFTSIDMLMEWVKTTGIQHRVVVNKRRSKKTTNGELTKVELKCEQGLQAKSTGTLRNCSSKRTDCPFALVAKYNRFLNGWTLQVVRDEHNHPIAEYLEGHAYAMRFNDSERRLVEDMTRHNVEPRNILSAVREMNPQNVSGLRNIYNVQHKLRREGNDGKTPMQVFFSQLHEKQYVYEFRSNIQTNVVDDVFFVHKDSFQLWRAFSRVLVIDTTYKTNCYKMPFVEIVGVTSTRKNFCVGFAFLSYEREENFCWMLTQLRSTLDNCMLPHVIVTDREIALIKACKQVFPEAYRLLCRFHVTTENSQVNLC